MFRKILIPYDLSEASREALFLGERHLKQNPKNELVILHAIPVLPAPHLETGEATSFYPLEMATSIESHVRSHLHSLGYSSNLLNQVEISVEWGDPMPTILAHEAQADLLAMTTHGYKGIKKFLLGTVAEKVVRHAKKPVLIVREAKKWPPKRILVPVSFEERSYEALKRLVSWFPEAETEYHLIHVLAEPDLLGLYEDVLKRPLDVDLNLLVRKAQENMQTLEKMVFTGPVTSKILRGHLTEETNKYARSVKADLVAIPTHHHEGLRLFLLGSESEKMVREIEQNTLCMSI